MTGLFGRARRVAVVGFAAAAISLAQGRTEETRQLLQTSAAMEACAEARARKDIPAAAASCAEAVRLSGKLPSPLFEMKSDTLKKLAEVRDSERKPEEAEALIKECIAILESHPAEPRRNRRRDQGTFSGHGV